MVRWAASDSQLVVVDPGTGKAWWFNGQNLAASPTRTCRR